MVKRATLLADTEYITPTVLPFEITNFARLQFVENGEEAFSSAMQNSAEPVVKVDDSNYLPRVQTASEPAAATRSIEINENSLKGASIDAEYEMIVEALRKANYNKSKAAKILNVDRKTLYNKMKQYKQFNSEV